MTQGIHNFNTQEGHKIC